MIQLLKHILTFLIYLHTVYFQKKKADFKKCLTATISIFLKGVWDYKSFFNSSSNKEKSFFILVIEL